MAGLSPRIDNELPIMSGGGTPMAQPINDATDGGAGSSSAQWALENDPVYQQAMLGGQSAFNMARANALAGLQNQQVQSERGLSNMKKTAASARRNLAGNFAARGMMGGARGAYYRAQDAMNAEDIAAQTSVKDQMAELNRQFLSNFGDVNDKNFDWTATMTGQQYRSDAIQQAINAALARYGAL
jgi:hypothetical protein